MDISSNYVKLSEIDHILKRSSIYIGSIISTCSTMYIHDNNKFIAKTVDFNPGLLKLFDEIISNCVDEHIRSGNVTTIKVNVSKLTNEITVSDDGGIPVVKHKEYNKWIPELIFSELRTGSNFNDDERSTAGQNGLGSKLVSVFSKKFSITTADGKNMFKQTLSDNMKNKSIPSITKSSNRGTTIVFEPDYAALTTRLNEDNYNQIIKRCYDVAGCNPNIKVYVNDKLINIKSFQQYALMYVDDVIYNKQDDWEICLAPSKNDAFKHVSFVNGVNTYEGGSHIDYITNQIVTAIREFILKKHKIDIKPNNIKHQLFILINCNINAPVFNSQTKEKLVSNPKDYGSVYNLSDKFIKQIINSPIVKNILLWAEGEQRKKEIAELNKINKQAAKKNAIKRIAKFDDASTKVRHSAMCVFTEGDSASKAILSSRNPKTTGIFPLKGKILNVRDIPLKTVASNVEIQNIMTILGLKIGEKYSKQNLRFGKIVISPDQDLDGFHILGLFINFINEFWPELLKDGYVYRLRTPLIIAYPKNKRKNALEFFTTEECTNYFKDLSNNLDQYEIKYQKGLGGWMTKDFKRFLEDPKYLVKIECADDDVEYIDIAFDKSKSNIRKEWLIND